MKLRVVERPWDIDRRRYAVEQLRWTTTEGEEFWGVEKFFDNVLDAQLFLASYSKGPRVVTVREVPGS